MASSHVSPKVHSTNFGFFAALNDSLTLEGHDITWAPSSISWSVQDLEKYDAVFVGVVAPTSVSANRSYGALNVIQKLFNSDKLFLVIDSPQHWMIEHSLSSVVRDPSKLISPFYSKRAEYSLATKKENLDILADACEKLLNGAWPKTIYPSLPWKTESSVSSSLPKGASNSLIGINLDALYISKDSPEPKFDQNNWVTTESNSTWATALSRTIRHSISPIRSSKADTNEKISETISNSIGVLIAPQRRKGGTWWSFTYVQALNELIPIATEWRESSKIGKSWNVLASEIEDMTPMDRYLLATKQREDYLNSINSNTENSALLKTILGLAKKEIA